MRHNDVRWYTIADARQMKIYDKYNRGRIEKLFSSCESITVSGVATSKAITDHDKGIALGQMMPWPDDFVLPIDVTYLYVGGNAELVELVVPKNVTHLNVIRNPLLNTIIVHSRVREMCVSENALGVWIKGEM